jgi:hypothetical protein
MNRIGHVLAITNPSQSKILSSNNAIPLGIPNSVS